MGKLHGNSNSFKDRVGQTLGRVTIVQELGDDKVIGRCICGTVREFRKSSLVTGCTKSCGCLRRRK